MRILGIDPGTFKTGYGIIDEQKGSVLTMVSCGCLESRQEKPSQRYFEIYTKLTELVQQYQPQCCAIESAFFSKNQKVTMRLSEVRGVLVLSAAQVGMDVFEYSPLEVKRSVVGYGRADKTQVRSMIKSILSLKKMSHENDVSDALAVAVCHVHHKKSLLYKALKTL